MVTPDYVHRRPSRITGKKDCFVAALALPELPRDLSAREYPSLEGPNTRNYLEYTGLTEEDLAEVGLAPMKPAGRFRIEENLIVTLDPKGREVKRESVREMIRRAEEHANETLEKAGLIGPKAVGINLPMAFPGKVEIIKGRR